MSTSAPTLQGHPVLAPDILAGFHLLEADAGTGKTWTIAGLVVRALLERGLGIDQILVVTFTNAARDELAARIRERIVQLEQLLDDRLAGRASRIDEPFCVAYSRGIAEPAAAQRALRIALARIDEAAVRTIHAYCSRVIAEHALSIGVRLDGEVDDRGSQWIERGVAEWWRAALEQTSAPALELLRASGVSPAGLVSALVALDRVPGARMLPERADWRALAEPWLRLRAALGTALDREAAALAEWISVKGQVDAKVHQLRWLAGRLARLRAFADGTAPAATPPDDVARFTSEAFSGSQARYPVPPLELVAICDALQALRPALADLGAQVALEAWAHVAESRAALKRVDGGVDHDDLLRVVHDALDGDSGEVLAAALRARHPLALIDECQDTDALQWAIFRRVYAPHTQPSREGLILVGDPKQAIYAFRAADVYSYLEARAARPGLQALHENQRSVPPLIEAVNALFERDAAFLVPEIRFAPSREGAKPRRAFDAAVGRERAALTLMMLPTDDPGGMLDRGAAADASVEAVVREIAGLLTGGAVRIGDAALGPADIAVLVNSHREGSLVKRALAAAGIGAIEISRDSVLASRECEALVRIVAAVADPADMGLVRAALATTPAGFDAAAIAALEQDAAGLARILDTLSAARRAWVETGPQAALRRLMLSWEIGPRLARLRDGDRRLANLMHLLELLAAHAEPREGAHAALRWLGRMRADPSVLGGEAGELRLESDDDLVRIVTVHKSKGLEFPVVFLPFAWNGRAARADAPLHYHVEAPGGWAAVADLRGNPDEPARARSALETHAEGLRALYVALTRAEHRCYVCWGAASGAQFAPLAWLLADLDPLAQKAWKRNSSTAPALTGPLALEGARQWQARANARHPGAIDIVEIGAAGAFAAPPASLPGEGAAPVCARAFSGRIPAPWIRTSFTALHAMLERAGAGAAGERPGTEPPAMERAGVERPDHDQTVPQAAPAQLAYAPASADAGRTPDIRDAFPAGTQAGVCLHGILEFADFARGVDPALAADWLGRSGYDVSAAPAVAGWLDTVLDAALPDLGGGSMRLRELAATSTVREMEFVLPAEGFDNASLVDAVAASYPVDLHAARSRWSGFLRGFVDLVFEHEGRYHVVDWKSNHLGEGAACYEAAALERAVASHAYALQFCLYTLAVHRMLAARIVGYDYRRDFGGVYYVFLRGVSSSRTGGGTPGVYATRPPFELIERLDALFAGAP